MWLKYKRNSIILHFLFIHLFCQHRLLLNQFLAISDLGGNFLRKQKFNYHKYQKYPNSFSTNSQLGSFYNFYTNYSKVISVLDFILYYSNHCSNKLIRYKNIITLILQIILHRFIQVIVMSHSILQVFIHKHEASFDKNK